MANKHDDKWSDEKLALKKIQMHFSFKEQLNRRIRYEAVEQNINPSDVIRNIVGLAYQRIQRPRIGLSFTQNDLKYLSLRYNLSAPDEKEIKQRVMDEVKLYYHNGDNVEK